MKKLRWQRNPQIGFWLDKDPIRLYYGADGLDLDQVYKQGIIGLQWLDCYLDPYSPDSETLLVIEVPMRWLYPHMDQRFGGNKEEKRKRLLQKVLYIKWTRFDYLYYRDAKIRIAKAIPPRFILGYMEKV